MFSNHKSCLKIGLPKNVRFLFKIMWLFLLVLNLQAWHFPTVKARTFSGKLSYFLSVRNSNATLIKLSVLLIFLMKLSGRFNIYIYMYFLIWEWRVVRVLMSSLVAFVKSQGEKDLLLKCQVAVLTTMQKQAFKNRKMAAKTDDCFQLVEFLVGHLFYVLSPFHVGFFHMAYFLHLNWGLVTLSSSRWKEGKDYFPHRRNLRRL